MAASEMNTHTLYLDVAIIAAVVYPAGAGYSLYTSLWGSPRRISPGLLGMLALPLALVVPAVYALRPDLIVLTGTQLPWIVAAVLLGPVALALEAAVQSMFVWYTTGRFPRAITVHDFWRRRLAPSGYLLLVLIAAGEELFYRAIWIAVLISVGVGTPAALVISSAAYGVNHLSFGISSVAAKTLTGLLYGAIYLAGDRSIALPIVAHVIQNSLILELARRGHA
jgi:uncharacterized protein